MYQKHILICEKGCDKLNLLKIMTLRAAILRDCIMRVNVGQLLSETSLAADFLGYTDTENVNDATEE